jgi:hypothetical protein
MDNPQYRLHVDAPTDVALKLDGPRALAVNVKLVRCLMGQRVEECVSLAHCGVPEFMMAQTPATGRRP